MDLLFPLVLLALMYVLLVRPQQQRVRRQRELVSSLGVADRVVTAGGIVGTILELDDEFARVEVAPGTVVRVLRPAITRRLDEGEEGTA